MLGIYFDLHVKRTEHAFNRLEDSRYLIEGKNQGNIIDFINNLLQACSDQPLIFCEYSHWTGTKERICSSLPSVQEFDRNTYMIELYNPNGPDDDASSYWKTIQNVVDEYDRNSSNPYTLIFTGSVWDTLVEEYIDIRRAFRAFHYELSLSFNMEGICFILCVHLIFLIILNPTRHIAELGMCLIEKYQQWETHGNIRERLFTNFLSMVTSK